MIKKTSGLLGLAGISFVTPEGVPVKTMASSWRAGGVKSAKDAGLSDGTIMAQGRWSSIAWTNYSFASISGLQAASGAMWSAALTAKAPSRLVVGSFSPAEVGEASIPDEVQAQVRRC